MGFTYIIWISKINFLLCKLFYQLLKLINRMLLINKIKTDCALIINTF